MTGLAKSVLLAAVTAAAALASTANAQTPVVDSARNMGVIGERYDGYVGYVTPPIPPLRSQVEAINIRRRALYSNLAASRGVSPQEVGITAGCQLLRRVQLGEAYLLPDGVWRRRAANQSAPVPDYCG